jgi:HK97 family phage prohead protease
MQTRMGIARFKSQVRRGLALPSDYRVFKTIPVQVESAGTRRRRFTISTESVDRDNDTISLRGWMLDSFARNPVVFYNHETYDYPIGKAVEISVSGSALRSTVEFMPSTIPNGAGEAAEAVFQMVEGGFLCAASVGFRPLEYTTAKSRMSDDDWWPAMDFTKVELMEWSVVGIPANPDAVADSDERAAMVELQSLELTRRSASAGTSGKTAAEIAARRRELRAACYR